MSSIEPTFDVNHIGDSGVTMVREILSVVPCPGTGTLTLIKKIIECSITAYELAEEQDKNGGLPGIPWRQ
jgi:hypothetical protein